MNDCQLSIVERRHYDGLTHRECMQLQSQNMEILHAIALGNIPSLLDKGTICICDLESTIRGALIYFARATDNRIVGELAKILNDLSDMINQCNPNNVRFSSLRIQSSDEEDK